MVTNLSGLLGLADVMLHDDVLSICVISLRQVDGHKFVWSFGSCRCHATR